MYIKTWINRMHCIFWIFCHHSDQLIYISIKIGFLIEFEISLTNVGFLPEVIIDRVVSISGLTLVIIDFIIHYFINEMSSKIGIVQNNKYFSPQVYVTLTVFGNFSAFLAFNALPLWIIFGFLPLVIQTSLMTLFVDEMQVCHVWRTKS